MCTDVPQMQQVKKNQNSKDLEPNNKLRQRDTKVTAVCCCASYIHARITKSVLSTLVMKYCSFSQHKVSLRFFQQRVLHPFLVLSFYFMDSMDIE